MATLERSLEPSYDLNKPPFTTFLETNISGGDALHLKGSTVRQVELCFALQAIHVRFTASAVVANRNIVINHSLSPGYGANKIESAAIAASATSSLAIMELGVVGGTATSWTGYTPRQGRYPFFLGADYPRITISITNPQAGDLYYVVGLFRYVNAELGMKDLRGSTGSPPSPTPNWPPARFD